MAVDTKSDAENEVVHTEEFDALHAILSTPDFAISYEEAESIGRELISFFEALGEDNEQPKDDDNA